MLMHINRDDGSARGQLLKQNFWYELESLHATSRFHGVDLCWKAEKTVR